MDTNQYLDLFLDESREHLQSLNTNLLELEKSPGELSIVNEIFRSAHTLKGMSATMGYQSMADLTHKMENVLDSVRHGELNINGEIMDVLFSSVDRLESMVEGIAAGSGDSQPANDIIEQLLKVSTNTHEPTPVHTTAAKTVSIDGYDSYEMTVIEQSIEQGHSVFRITVGVREDCVLKAARAYMVFQIAEQIGEIIKSEPTVDKLEEGEFDTSFIFTIITKEPLEDIREKILKVSEIEKVDMIEIHPNSTAGGQDHEDSHHESTESTSTKAKGNSRSIRVNLERIDVLMNLFEELIINRGRLEGHAREIKDANLTEIVEGISRTTSHLQDIILNLRMVPIEQVFNRFPRMVRGVAKDLNKKVNLSIFGQETELDRTVIDEIGDPLVHLLRNSIDHGIETPEKRRALNKPEEGSIELKAYHSGSHVFIEIKDDGAGINRENVLKKAIKNGLVDEQTSATLSDQDVFQLLFQTGFSTAEVISDISGRGVGLDVVKSKIESLGGVVSVESTLNQGSIFSIKLPLTLSIITAMLVKVRDEHYAVPLSNIVETAMIKEEDILSAHQNEMIEFRGRVIPFVRLSNILDVPGQEEKGKFIPALIIQNGSKSSALAVDRLIGQLEIVIKPLGNYLGEVEGISGATILGDGHVALILNAASFI